MKTIHDEVVGPIAQPQTPGAWYRKWRIVSLDGSTLDVADSEEMSRSLVILRQAGGAAHTRNCVSSRYWKMEPMYCLRRASEATVRVS
jgi:hypothetical protein